MPADTPPGSVQGLLSSEGRFDDSGLLRRYAEAREEQAFAELVRRHLDGVYAAALRRVGGDAHLAQDVAQQVFVALARKAATLASHPALTSWLYTATRHQAANAVRAERRRKHREWEALAMQENAHEPEAARGWSRLAPVLDAAMDELSEADRTAVLLRFAARRAFADIGRALAVSEDAARMRVDRALEKLRARLARRGVVSTAAALALLLHGEAAAAAPAGLAGAVTGAAMASAAAPTGLLPGLIQFMNTSKLATGAVAIAVAASVGVIGCEFYRYRAVASEVAALREGHAALQAREHELRERQRQAEAWLVEKQAALAAARAAQAEARQRAAAAATEAQAAALAAGNAFVERHPQVKQAYLDMQRGIAAGWYAPLFAQLGLSADEIDACVELLAARGVVSARAPGGKSTRFDLGDSRAEMQRALRNLLGEERFKTYEDYSRSLSSEILFGKVVNLAGDLYDTAFPLSASQGETLRRILAEETVAGASSLGDTRWENVVERARRFLAPEQLESLETYRASDEYLSAVGQPRRQAANTAKE